MLCYGTGSTDLHCTAAARSGTALTAQNSGGGELLIECHPSCLIVEPQGIGLLSGVPMHEHESLEH